MAQIHREEGRLKVSVGLYVAWKLVLYDYVFPQESISHREAKMKLEKKIELKKMELRDKRVKLEARKALLAKRLTVERSHGVLQSFMNLDKKFNELEDFKLKHSKKSTGTQVEE